jgi:hypothetical protein
MRKWLPAPFRPEEIGRNTSSKFEVISARFLRTFWVHRRADPPGRCWFWRCPAKPGKSRPQPPASQLRLIVRLPSVLLGGSLVSCSRGVPRFSAPLCCFGSPGFWPRPLLRQPGCGWSTWSRIRCRDGHGLAIRQRQLVQVDVFLCCMGRCFLVSHHAD